MDRHEGKYEYKKFASRRKSYDDYIEKVGQFDLSAKHLIENFSIYSGHLTISRFIGLYEMYKMSLGVAGHIMEIGVFQGASLLWFAKLVKIFEHEGLTQVHGFDWFMGTGADSIENKVELGTYQGNEGFLREMIMSQELDDTCFIHNMDVTKELKGFLDENRHMQFKLIFFDAGLYDVVSQSLPLVWERLTVGGILIFDQYNHELSPGETMAIREILPNAKVRTLPNIWMPTGYIIKE